MHPVLAWLLLNGVVALELAVIYLINRRRRVGMPPQKMRQFIVVVLGLSTTISAILLLLHALDGT